MLPFYVLTCILFLFFLFSFFPHFISPSFFFFFFLIKKKRSEGGKIESNHLDVLKFGVAMGCVLGSFFFGMNSMTGFDSSKVCCVRSLAGQCYIAHMKYSLGFPPYFSSHCLSNSALPLCVSQLVSLSACVSVSLCVSVCLPPCCSLPLPLFPSLVLILFLHSSLSLLFFRTIVSMSVSVSVSFCLSSLSQSLT